MTLDPEVLTCEGADISQTEELCSPGLDRNRQILGVIHQRGLRHRFSAGWISDAYEILQHRWHLLVVPIRQVDHTFFVVLSEIPILGVREDQRLAEAIRILARDMRMVPVCTGLVDL